MWVDALLFILPTVLVSLGIAGYIAFMTILPQKPSVIMRLLLPSLKNANRSSVRVRTNGTLHFKIFVLQGVATRKEDLIDVSVRMFGEYVLRFVFNSQNQAITSAAYAKKTMNKRNLYFYASFMEEIIRFLIRVEFCYEGCERSETTDMF